MDWQVQFIVAFMSIVYIAAVTSSYSSAHTLYPPTRINAQLYTTYSNDATTATTATANGKRELGIVKMSNVNDSLKSYPYRRSYSATLSAALNGLRDYTGLQHISSSYMPIPKASSDNLDGRAIEAKQQIPIYEDQSSAEHDSSAAGVSAASTTSLGTNPHAHNTYYTQPTFNRENNQYSANDALSTAIYNLHEAGTHNNYYGGNTATPSTTSSGEWPSSGNAAAWSQTDDFQQFLDSNDKSKVNSFQYHYESSPYYSQQQPQQQQQYTPQEYFTPENSNSNDNEHEHENYSPYEEPNNYLSKPDEEHYKQQPDVINYIPYPVVKKLHVPVHQPIQIPVSHAVIMPVSKPVPIHIPVTHQVQVPVEKDLKIPVERVVPYPVEKHVPVPVEKRVPYPVVRYVPVKVPRPYPIKVPVYKTVYHRMKSLW